MSELYESSPVETGGLAGDSGSGRGPEVGESGPAGVAEPAAGAGDKALQGAGDVAGQAGSAGREGLQEAGKLTGDAQATGGESLQEAGKLADGAQAAGSGGLQEAGKLSEGAQAAGRDGLQEAGRVADGAQAIGSEGLQEAGRLAERAQAIGGEGLQEAGKLAGDAQVMGGDVLQKAGDVGGIVEADAGKALSEAGNIAGTVGADGARALGDAGTAAGKLESGAAGDMERVMAPVAVAREAAQLSGLDLVQPAGPGRGDAAPGDAAAGDNAPFGGGWGGGLTAETGESGPAGYAEAGPAGGFGLPGGAEPGDWQRAMAQVDAGNWDQPWFGAGGAGASLETGESGPAGAPLEAVTEIVAGYVAVTAETQPDDATESSGDSAQAATGPSGFDRGEASPGRLEHNLSPADLAQRNDLAPGKGRGG